MNESKAETFFCKAVRDEGGMVLKLRHRFMAGLPDTYVKMPVLDGIFIEFKFQPWPKKKEFLTLDLSPLQRKFLRDCRRMHQPAVWALMTKRPDYGKPHGVWSVVFGADPDETGVSRLRWKYHCYDFGNFTMVQMITDAIDAWRCHVGREHSR